MNLMNRSHTIEFLAALALLAGASAGPIWAADESAASLRAEATITEAVAARTALARVPDGSIKSSELEREHGKLIWSFDIARPKSRNIAEVHVDAKTGKVLAEETETPHDQAAEASTEHEEHK
jgi:uncharacterized membrane protein YkoI